MAGHSKSSSSSQDLLMISFQLDYINKILMEESDDDAVCMHMQQVNSASYQAVFSSFSEILSGAHLPPNSCTVDSTCDDDASVDAHLPNQRLDWYHEKEPAEQHVKGVNPSEYGLSNVVADEPRNLGASGISLPANVHRSGQEERAESGFTLHHVMALKPTQIPGLHDGMCSSAGSCLNSNGKDAVVAGLSTGHGCIRRWHEQSNDNFELLSADEELSSKLAELDLSFEDFKLNDVYTDLYVGEPSSNSSSLTKAATDSKHSGDNKKSLAGKGSRTAKRGTLQVHAFVDVREVLVRCAEAVATGDVRRTNEILQELRKVHGASANGTSLQRTAHFFSKALAARLRGVGEDQFRGMSLKMPSMVDLLRATAVAYQRIPYLKLGHYFANQSILKAAEGASRLHIVDYGLMYGIQWPCLISALAERKGGPPALIITGIEFRQTGVNPTKRLAKSGQRLAAYAKTYNVPFQYRAIVSNKADDVDAASLNLHKAGEDEVLIVNCIKCLRHLSDEGVDSASPRQKLLTFMRSLYPHVLLISVTSAEHNSPFFVSRFRQALRYFSNIFDMLETLWGGTLERLALERSCFYRDILNIVGCEGAERVDRPETYKQWHARITKAGFEQLPLPPTIVPRLRAHVKQHHHHDFLIHDDGKGWMLMGWKGFSTIAVSAWKPTG